MEKVELRNEIREEGVSGIAVTHTESEELSISPIHLIDVTIYPCNMDDIHMSLDG